MTAARIHSKRQPQHDDAGEQDLGAGGRPDEDHAPQRNRFAGLDQAALFVEPDGDERTDDHEGRDGGKQDVVETEEEKSCDDRDGNDEHGETVGKAGTRLCHEITPAGAQPAEGGADGKMAIAGRREGGAFR